MSPAQPVIRPLTATEAQAVAAARLVAVDAAPYLAHALFAMRPVAAEGLGTFAVDAAWRCYLDPATLAAWGPALSGGVLVHEVCHLIREHAGRAGQLGSGLDHATWNYATDAAINDDVLAAGVALPEGAVTPAALGLPANGVEESYYQQLRRDRPELGHDHGQDSAPGSQDASADGSTGGCGSGAGDPAAPWELGGDDPHAPALSAGEADLTRRLVAHEIREHTGRGTVPAGLGRWAQESLAGPVVPWQRVLGSAVRRAVAWARGASDYTYARPGRRQIPGIITPAMRKPVVTAAAVIDTSASMSQAMVDAALAEVTGIIRATGLGQQALAVLSCDAAAGPVSRVRRVQDVQMTGGGGTDMRAGIDAAHALRPAPDVVIVLTDGYTPWPDRPTRARLIIGVICDRPGQPVPGGTPPWATTIPITLNQ